MMNKLRRWKADRRGTATIEMGLTLPLLFLVMFPPMEFARYTFADRTLKDSVNEGARFAALTLTVPGSTVTEDDVRDIVIQNAGGYAPERDAIDITYFPAKVPGARVTVTANADFGEIFNVFGDLTHRVDGTRTLF